MRASTRRTLAMFSAAALALAACGDGDDTDPAAGDQPDGQELPDDLDPDELPDELDGQEPPEPPTFEEGDLEDGEVVPGVRLEVPDGGNVEAGPGPTGASFSAQYEDQEAVVFIEAAAAGLSLDQLLQGLDQIEESGEAEITDGPSDVDVPGADEAQRIELVDVEGREATLVVAVAGEGAVSLAIEQPGGEGFEVDPIVDSLEVDGDRIGEGAQPMPEQPQDLPDDLDLDDLDPDDLDPDDVG